MIYSYRSINYLTDILSNICFQVIFINPVININEIFYNHNNISIEQLFFIFSPRPYHVRRY